MDIFLGFEFNGENLQLNKDKIKFKDEFEGKKYISNNIEKIIIQSKKRTKPIFCY